MKLIRVVVFLAALAVAATACSGSEVASTASEAAPFDAPPFDAVLVELFGTNDTEAYLVTAERAAAEIVVSCMEEAGFDFQIPALRDELDLPDPASVDDARATGFGIIAGYRLQISQLDAATDFGGDPNLAYLSTLTAPEVDRFLVTLDGPDVEPGQRKQDRGCNGEASDSAYADWVRFSEALPNYTSIGEERDTHPDWLTARSEWRDCMVERGFDYPEPDLIRINVISRMRDTVAEIYPNGDLPLVQIDGVFALDPELDVLLEDLAQFEQAAAVANVECTLPIADQFDAVERLVQQGFVDRNRDTIDSLLSQNT